MFQYLKLLSAFMLVLGPTNAQEGWSWSNVGGNTRKNNRDGPERFNVRSDVLAFQGGQAALEWRRDNFTERKGRYEVKETTTKRPGFTRPQNDEFSGEFGEGNPSNNFGINQQFGSANPGLSNGQFGQNPYGTSPSFISGGAFPFHTGNALGGGYHPGQHIAGGYDGRLGAYGTAGNGILVGPGGPTGIIGRPYSRFPYNGVGYNPGGIGYPYRGGFGNPAFGRQPGGFFPPAGYALGGFFQQQQPFGPRPFDAIGGGPQFGPQFDQSREATKKVEKRAN